MPVSYLSSHLPDASVGWKIIEELQFSIIVTVDHFFCATLRHTFAVCVCTSVTTDQAVRKQWKISVWISDNKKQIINSLWSVRPPSDLQLGCLLKDSRSQKLWQHLTTFSSEQLNPTLFISVIDTSLTSLNHKIMHLSPGTSYTTSKPVIKYLLDI